ncbi:hypothetical protein GCM10023191_101520 [Actinoallomurus oryzae]|uniref:Uncharacterized protein n=1 Tax=Actinoallomurus oryzae TaxID=502180 RepID=A0ABP8R9B2_9ACTN
MGSKTKALLGLTAVGVAASVLVPTAANAASGSFRFCNVSSAGEYVDVPPRGTHAGITTRIISPGACTTFSLGGNAYMEAIAYRRVNGVYPAVATKWFYTSRNYVWNV